MEMKICSKCGAELPATKEYFHIRKDAKDGLRNECRECRIKRERQRWEKNRVAISKRQKAYCLEHKETIAARAKQYYDINKLSIQAQKKQYNSKNKEHKATWSTQYRKEHKVAIAEQAKQYYETHRKSILEQKKLYQAEHAKDISVRRKRYYEENRPAISERSKQWARNNKTKRVIIRQRRKAREYALPATLTAEQWAQTKEYFNNRCAYCGRKLELTQEHIIPVAKGGHYSRENIIPACKTCNSSKRAKDFMQWYPTYKYYSEERADAIINYMNSI